LIAAYINSHGMNDKIDTFRQRDEIMKTERTPAGQRHSGSFEASRRVASPEPENCITRPALPSPTPYSPFKRSLPAETLKVGPHKAQGESDISLVNGGTTATVSNEARP
jgi:hypothetical protein